MEILLHLAILILGVLPVVLFILPVLVAVLSLFLILNGVAAVLPALHGEAERLSNSVGTLEGITTIVILTAAGLAYRRNLRQLAQADIADSRGKPLQGKRGEDLVEISHQLWRQLSGDRVEPPRVVWFPSLHVLAHAQDVGGQREIQVSAGLWDRVVRRDSLSRVILAHEMAHLVRRDPLWFRRLAALVAVTRSVLKRVGALAGVTLGLLLVERFGEDARGGTLWRLIAHQLTIAILGALVLAFLPLCLMIVRRYVGFLGSLLELRADVSAACWTGGLDNFAATFAYDLSIHRSTWRDRGRSLLSLDLTHLSETERIELLQSPERLATPKLRYFLLSLVLPFLLPLGAATPLFEGGAFDHLMIAYPVVALHFGLFAMVIVTAPALPKGLNWLRGLSVAGGLDLAAALPHIDLAPIGYFLTNLALSMSVSGGFGGAPMTAQQIGSDITLTLSDVSHKVLSAFDFGWTAATIPVVTLALGFLRWRASRGLTAKRERFTVAVATATVGAFVALLLTYDEFRNELFSFWPLTWATPLMQVTQKVPWSRAVLPTMAALLSFELLTLALRCRPRKSLQPGG